MVDNKRSIFACYKMSDYTVDGWVDNVWTSVTNAEYRQRLSATPVIKSLLEFCKDTRTITEVQDFCKTLSEGHDFVSLILLLWSIYYRENTCGPSIFTEYVEETRAPLNKSYLVETELDLISTKNNLLHNVLLKHYEKDGEPFYQNSQLLIILTLLEITLTREVLSEEERWFSKLMTARVSYLKDQSLTSSIVHLKDASLTLFNEYIQ